MSIKTWTPKLGSTKVRIEPDNHVDKFAVCVEKKNDGKISVWKIFKYYFLFSSQ